MAWRSTARLRGAASELLRGQSKLTGQSYRAVCAQPNNFASAAKLSEPSCQRQIPHLQSVRVSPPAKQNICFSTDSELWTACEHAMSSAPRAHRSSATCRALLHILQQTEHQTQHQHLRPLHPSLAPVKTPHQVTQMKQMTQMKLLAAKMRTLPMDQLPLASCKPQPLMACRSRRRISC